MAISTRTSVYAGPMALVHAHINAGRISAGFDWLGQQVLNAPGPAKLLDLGCGDGAWIQAAINNGIAAQGIDTTLDFVNICQANGLDVQQNSAAQTVIPAATTAITALGQVLSYKPSSLSPVALNAARALPKGGVFIFDLPGPDMAQTTEKISIPAPRTAQNPGPKTWHLENRSFISGATLTRHVTLEIGADRHEETHFQHLFTPSEVRGILAGFGFQLRILDAYGDGTLSPGCFGVLAQKR